MLKKLFLAVLASLSFSFALAAVDLNTATVEQLSTLKGIKAKKATAIVEYRQKKWCVQISGRFEKCARYRAKNSG